MKAVTMGGVDSSKRFFVGNAFKGKEMNQHHIDPEEHKRELKN